MTRPKAGALVACAGLALGCLAPEPLLYPNETLRATEESQVDHDVDECGELAKKYVAGPGREGEIARSTVEDAAVGSAAGAAGGAVLGNAGAGAAAGAAGGAAGGLVRGIFRSRREPDPRYKMFVERCLEEKGYEVVGWQ